MPIPFFTAPFGLERGRTRENPWPEPSTPSPKGAGHFYRTSKSSTSPYDILPTDEKAAEDSFKTALKTLQKNQVYAFVVRKNSFSKHNPVPNPGNRKEYALSREEAIRQIAGSIPTDSIIVSTTGKASRELFEYRTATDDTPKDFLTVGSMGHASQIALGIAIQKPEKSIYCLDGDGALLMHMGSLAIIGSLSPNNFKHIVLNNEAHDSVGGQPTASKHIDIPAMC